MCRGEICHNRYNLQWCRPGEKASSWRRRWEPSESVLSRARTVYCTVYKVKIESQSREWQREPVGAWVWAKDIVFFLNFSGFCANLLSVHVQTLLFTLWSTVLGYFLGQNWLIKAGQTYFWMTFQAIWRQILNCLSRATFSWRLSVCAIFYAFYNYSHREQ